MAKRLSLLFLTWTFQLTRPVLHCFQLKVLEMARLRDAQTPNSTWSADYGAVGGKPSVNDVGCGGVNSLPSYLRELYRDPYEISQPSAYSTGHSLRQDISNYQAQAWGKFETSPSIRVIGFKTRYYVGEVVVMEHHFTIWFTTIQSWADARLCRFLLEELPVLQTTTSGPRKGARAGQQIPMASSILERIGREEEKDGNP